MRFSRSSAEMNRREFVAATAVAGAALAVPAALGQTKQGDMIYRLLGNTGEKISALGLGGFHIGTLPTKEESIRLIRTAIDRGMSFMDNCWDYHNGKSELWMGEALRDGYRQKVFLMTKIDGQKKTSAARQINESLKRLQTDRIDLMQMHEMIRSDDPERIFAEDGAIAALLDAKKAGKIRFFGFTGHKDPKIHLKVLEFARKNNFSFDAVQMPLNVMDAHFKSFEKQVLPVLVREKIGVLGMKPLGSGAILESKKATAVECLHYAMSLPTSTVITGIDSMKILEQAFEAARTFKPLDETRRKELLAKTADSAKAGEFEKFKTTTNFDGTVQHPEWLGLAG
jgi:predicted aldo/keto reductase-like oxidoreductase